MKLRVCLIGLGLTAAMAQAEPLSAWQEGRSIFVGDTALQARVSANSQPLPSAASRCVNCHAGPGRPSASPTAFAVPLNSAWLLQARPRRGGPASRYDAAALCRLLQTGVDPAGVVLPSAMPRYRLADSQCLQLWAYLTSDL
jgi:hypothetical protein